MNETARRNTQFNNICINLINIFRLLLLWLVIFISFCNIRGASFPSPSSRIVILAALACSICYFRQYLTIILVLFFSFFVISLFEQSSVIAQVLSWCGPTIPTHTYTYDSHRTGNFGNFMPYSSPLISRIRVYHIITTAIVFSYGWEVCPQYKSFSSLYGAQRISGQKVSTKSWMAAISLSSLREHWYYLVLSSNIRVKGDKMKRENNPRRLPLETWCSLSVPQCAASNRENWNSWCLYR